MKSQFVNYLSYTITPEQFKKLFHDKEEMKRYCNILLTTTEKGCYLTGDSLKIIRKILRFHPNIEEKVGDDWHFNILVTDSDVRSKSGNLKLRSFSVQTGDGVLTETISVTKAIKAYFHLKTEKVYNKQG